MKPKLLLLAGVRHAALLSLLVAQFTAHAQSPGCVAPPAGLVSWWRAEGSATDLVGGNHGTLLNGATFATGETGQGFSFDGVNDLVKIPRSASLNGGSQITIEFWMKASPGNAMNTYQGLVTSDFFGIEIANGYVLGPLGVSFFISTDGGASVSSSSYPDTATVNGGGAVVSAGVWHHVAGTYDGTKLQLYIDGQPWGNPNYHTGAISPMLANSFVAIGSEDGRTVCPDCVSNRYFKGLIDEPSIYNRALSAGEILSIYNAGSAGKCVPPASGILVGPIQNPANGHCYYLLQSNTWTAAEAEAVAIGGHLVTVNDAAEQVWVYQTFSNYGGIGRNLWIGLYDPSHDSNGQSHESNFVWVNGEPVIYTQWSSGEPNNYNNAEYYSSMFGPADSRAPYWNDCDNINSVNAAGQILVPTYGVVEIPSCANNCASAPSGLVGLWKGEGNANDSIGTGNGTLSPSGASYTSGKVGQGFRFDGTNGYVQIPDSSVLKPANVTCEAWVWLDPNLPSNRGGEQIVFKKNTWSAWFEGYGLLKATIDTGGGTYSDRFQFVVSRYGNQVVINSQTIAQRGVWYHVAATYDGNQSKLYVNGVLEASATPGFALDYDTTPIFIGTSGTWAPYLSMFGGIIDEPSIYNRALSSNEIAAIYNAGSAGKCGSTAGVSCTAAPANLMVWLRAEGNFNDAIGTNNGVQTGGVTFTNGEAGQGLFFNGSSQLKLSASPSLNVGTSGGLTLETWIRPGQFTLYAPQFVFEWNDGAGNGGAQLLLSTDHGVYGDGFGNVLANLVDTLGNSHALWTATNVIVTNALQHAALTYDKASGLAVIYVNGLALASTNLGSFTPQTSYDFYLGNRVSGPFAGNYFNGQLDEPAIYNRALTPNEIAAIYNADSAGKCAPTMASSCVTPPSGMVGWWPGAGNANDVIGGHNATLQGGATFAPGKVGQGFRFDGTNGYAQIPDSAALKPANVTCEAWVWLDPSLPAGRGGEQIVFKKNTWSAWFEGYSLLKTTADNGDGTFSDRFQFCVSRQGNQVAINSPTVAQRGVWYHVAGTYDGNQSKLYVNGVLEASATPGFALDYDTTPIFIGTSGTWAPYLSMFGGIIDEPSIYNRALSANELAAIYAAGSAGKCATSITNNPPGLLNIDFGAGQGPSTKTGPAAASQSGSDFWNFYSRDDVNGNWRTFGALTDLRLADGTVTAIGLTVANAPGAWGNGSTDPMLDGFIYPFDGGDVTVTITNLPAGQYDVFPYSLNGNYEVTSGGTSYGIKSCYGFPVANPPVWTEGVQFTRFANVQVTAGQPVVVIVHPTQSDGALISGLQIVSTAGATNNCVSAPSDLAAWWPGNGSTDELIHGNNGTLGGGAAYTNAIVGQGFNFDGVSGRVTVPNSPSLNFGPGEDLSIECWIKAFPNGNPGNVRSIVEKRNVAENYRGYTLFLWDGFLSLQLAEISVGINYFSGGADLRDGVFHHVAASVQRNSATGGHLYVDGQLIYTFDPTGISGDLSNTDVLRLGQHATPGDTTGFFPGVIDDVAIYRRALSTSEIQSIYAAGSAGKCAPATLVCIAPPSSLVAWWQAENSTNDVTTSHNGTLANGLGFAPGKVGQAFSFDGVDDHFDIPASPGLDVGAMNGMTFETWVKPGSIAMQAVAEWNNGSGGGGAHLWLSVDHTVAGDGVGNIYVNLYDTTETSHHILSPAGVMNANEWQHLAVTYDKTSGLATIYRNGTNVAAQNLGVFTPQTSYDLHLGYRASSSFFGTYFGGLMDEPSLYARALSAAEIQAIYAAGSAGKCAPTPPNPPVMQTQPVAQTVTVGNSATFTALATGATPLFYQWQFNGTNISGATNTSLNLLNVQLNQGGNYSVVVSNTFDHISSSNALLTVNPAACVLPPAGLVSWWRAESNVLDNVTGNHGTLEGGATFAAGKAGSGFVFDGTNGYVQIPDSATLKPANVTIEAWVWLDPNANTGPTTESIIFKRNSWTFLFEGYTIAKSVMDNGDGTSSSRFLAVITRNGNQVIVQSTTVAQRGVWYHVAATYDGNTLTLYVNGAAEASASPGFALDYGDRPVFLGSTGEPEPYRSMLAGVIDEAAIYSRALSPNEIAGIYNASSAGKCDAPVAPTIVQQPQDTAVLAGTPATFNVAAAGSAPLAYQWFVNAAALTGETNSTLTLNNIVYPMTGNLYSVTITNVGGSVHSRDAVLTVINTPPQISNPGSQIVDYIAPPLGLPFTVSDAESSADNLQIFVNSSNTNLVPNAQVVVSGTGTNRLVTPTAITNLVGSTTITLTVVDEGGLSNQVSFGFTVINDSPTVSFIGPKHGPLNSAIGPILFTVSDSETPAAQLVVAATTSNNNIVPTNQIVFGVSGTDRTITILPGTNSLGTANVTITATDTLGASGSQTFSVTWDQFGDALAGLPALQYSAVAWGDYDNDGKLDLLVSGTTNGLPSGAVTRIYHNDNGAFTNFISLPGLFKCALAWSDYDRDGRLDIAMSGLNSTNQAFSRIYHNNGNGTFTDLNAGLTGCYAGSVAWGDFNSDGAADLFLCGLVTTTNGTTAVSTNIVRLYRNDGGGVFTDMNLDLRTFVDNRTAGPNNGTAAWGDFDNDGRLDLLLVGSLNGVSSVGTIYRNLGNGSFSNLTTTSFGGVISSSAALGDYDNDGRLDFAVFNTSGASSAVYHNNGNNTYTVAASFSGVSGPQIAWGDYNNDGYLDLLVGNSTGGIAKLYRNNGNGTFTDTLNTTLPPTSNGSLAWGDYNNDGTLDAVFLGTRSTLMRNVGNITNTPPAVPFDLVSATALTNGVVLRWQAPADSQTKSNGLNYNLRVGTNPGSIDIVSPLADPVTGLRRVAALGNVGPTNRALLVNLPKGTYYWSAQAIDTAFAGSAFPGAPTAVDGTFTITNARPVISDIADLVIAPGTNTPGPIIPFVIGDLETSASNLVLTVRSSNTNVVALTNIVFGGSGSNRTIRVAARTNGVSVITVTVTDAQGAFASDNFTVRAEQFSLQSSNFIQVQNSLIAWGDYNNDGRLDVLIAGNTNGSSSAPPVTQLYRNDGNGVFTPVAAGFPNVTFGSAAWGDFNNDGYLDLILTGTTNSFVSRGIANLYRNNRDGTFTDINAGLTGVLNSSVAWGDYDNDGRPDLLVIGSTNFTGSGGLSRIYHNNGDGTFSNAVTLPAFSSGAAAWGDFDGDGDLDLVLAGQNSGGTAVAQVYRNNGNGLFTLAATLTGVYNCSVAVGDFNNDGLPDILLTGYNGSYLSLLYRNTGNFSFVNTQTGLPGARYASVACGDADNDGRLDILLSGTSNGGATGGMTRLYRNTTTVPTVIEFSLLPTTLPTNYLGAVAWADFNNDGRLDVMITGVPFTLLTSGLPSQTALYRNNNNVTNTPPAAPASISAVRSNNVVSLAWAKATDAQTTNANGLKYQLRVGTNSGGIQIESPLADLSTGYRRVVQTGDASTNQWRLNLPPGNYFWSVQTIDTAFAGSPFATEATFTISRPPVANPDTITTASNTPASFAAAKLALNDTDPDGDPLTVIGVSATSVAGGTITFVSGQVTYTPPSGFTGSDAFTYTISDGQGRTAVGTVTATVGSGGGAALNLVFGPVVENGDFVVRFAGIPGFTYTLEATSDLAAPWVKVANLTAPAYDQGFGVGIFEFREPMGANSTRYYRTVYPSY